MSPAPSEASPIRIESSSSVTEGQALHLNCLVAGQSQPKVAWYKRGGALPANHKVWMLQAGVLGRWKGSRSVCPPPYPFPFASSSPPIQFLPTQISGSYLVIPQATVTDSGEYVCRVSDGGTVQETSVVVTVYSTSQSEPKVLFPPLCSCWRRGLCVCAQMCCWLLAPVRPISLRIWA